MREVFALGLAGLSVAVAGCSGSADGGAAATPTPTVAASSPAARPTAKPTSARRSPRPATVDAVCPYADATTIAETVGQRIARTTVTQTRPHVGCAYYRANGEQAVQIAVSTAGDPVTAQTRALAIAGPSANPVDDVGDGGAVTVTDAGSVLAVSAGSTIVVVRTNQRVSLEAAEIARMVVARI